MKGCSFCYAALFLTRPSSAEPRSSTRFFEEAEEEDSFEKVAFGTLTIMSIFPNLTDDSI